MIHRIRRAIVRALWYSDRSAALLAAWLRKGLRCFHCGVRLTPEEVEHYATACNACEGEQLATWGEV